MNRQRAHSCYTTHRDTIQDRADFGIEAWHGPAKCGVERAFADGKSEQVCHQAAEAAIADRVGEAQIDRQCHDVEAERVPGSNPCGSGASVVPPQPWQCPA